MNSVFCRLGRKHSNGKLLETMQNSRIFCERVQAVFDDRSGASVKTVRETWVAIADRASTIGDRAVQRF